jgi:hypothetical protein
VGFVAGDTSWSQGEAALRQALAVNKIWIFLCKVLRRKLRVLQPCLGLALAVTVGTKRCSISSRNCGVRIFYRHNVVIAVTAHTGWRSWIAMRCRPAVERLLVLPAFLTMAGAAIDFGWLWMGDVFAFKVRVASGAGQCGMDRFGKVFAVNKKGNSLVSVFGREIFFAVAGEAGFTCIGFLQGPC